MLRSRTVDGPRHAVWPGPGERTGQPAVSTPETDPRRGLRGARLPGSRAGTSLRTGRPAGLAGFLVPLLLALAPLPATAQLIGGNIYPVNGTHNPPASFSNLVAASLYLSAQGVVGAGEVVLELGPGYAGETGAVTIGPIPGAGPGLTVAFRPAPGYAAVTSIPGVSVRPWAVRITGSHVRLDGRAGGAGEGRDWTIRCTGEGTSGYGQSAVRIDNSDADVADVAVRWCLLEAEASNAASGVLSITGGSTHTLRDVLLEHNLVRSTGSAFPNCRGYAVALANASHPENTGLVVRENTIRQTIFRGISVTGGFPGVQIQGNDIGHDGAVTQFSPYEYSAIYFGSAASPGAVIRDNFIHDLQLTNAAHAINGIYLFNGNTDGEPVRIHNNLVAIGPGIEPVNVPVYGLRDNSLLGARFDVQDNSVWVGGFAYGGSANSAAYRREVSSTVDLRGNVFANARSNAGGTGTHWAISLNDLGNLAAIGPNDYHAAGVGGVLGTTNGWAWGNRETLEAWRAAVDQDSASVSEEPRYLNPAGSPPDLRIDGSVPSALESGGVALAGIETDFEGEPRHGAAGYSGGGTAPDLGADEFEGIAHDLAPPEIAFAPLSNAPAGPSRPLSAVEIADPSGVDGAAGTRPRCYFKKSAHANAWSGNTPETDGWKYVEAAGESSPFDFLLDYALLFGGGAAAGDTIEYFVVAQDLAPAVNVGIEAGSFAAPPASVDLDPAAFPIGGPIHRFALLETVQGAVTVGPGGNFPTLKAAFDDLNGKAVDGDVQLVILPPGTVETAQPVLRALTCVDGAWTVTIRPEPGAAATIAGAIDGGALVKLSGADRVVIEGAGAPGDTTTSLTIENTSAAAGTAAIWLAATGSGDGCERVAVRGCRLRCGIDQSAHDGETFGVFIGGDTLATGSGGTGHDTLAIAGNDIRRVRWGIWAAGEPGSPNDSLTVTDNRIGPESFGPDQIGRGGIVLRHQRAALVEGNEVRFVGSTAADSASGAGRVGIGVGAAAWPRDGSALEAAPAAGTTVLGNRVHHVIDEKGSSATGILLAGDAAEGATENLVANNFIRDVRANAAPGEAAIGLGIAAGEGDRVLFNSIRLCGDLDPDGAADAAAGACGLRIRSNVPAALLLANNAVSVDLAANDSTLRHFAVLVPDSAFAWGAGGSDHNAWHAAAGNPQAILGGLGIEAPFHPVPALADWRQLFTPPQDAASIDGDPLFRAQDDLHIDTTGQTTSPAAGAGVAVAGILADFDGEPRGAIPDIGADEFTTYVLTDSTDGPGTILRTPDYPSYNPGATVELVPQPAAGHAFTGWTGDHVGTENPLLLTMDADHAVVAHFDPLGLAVEDAEVVEGDEGSREARFAVVLAAQRADTVAVDFLTADSTAVAGADYLAASGRLLLPPGVVSDTIRVPVLGDSLHEGTERFHLVLRNPSGAILADSIGGGTIVDDDPQPRIHIADAAIAEGDAAGAASFAVTLNAPSALAVRVAWTTAEGTAAAGSDFTAAADTLVFPPLSVQQEILVAVVDDQLDEFDEAFSVGLEAISGGELADSAGVGTILDDDDPPPLSVADASVLEGDAPDTALAVFVVELGAASGKPVRVLFATADSTALAGEDYFAAGPDTLSFLPGDTLLTRTVAVRVAGDDDAEPDEHFRLLLFAAEHAVLADSSAVATILDDDAGTGGTLVIGDVEVVEGDAGAGEALFSVTLDPPLPVEVRVTAATTGGTGGGTAGEGTDYEAVVDTLVFPPFNTVQSFSVAVLGDALDEFDETFSVRLSGATGAAIGDSTAIGTILDDDEAPSLAVGDAALSEGDPPDTALAVFTVTLSAASGKPVRVLYATADSTALAGEDYLAAGPDTLFFPPGDTLLALEVAVPVLGDSADEQEEIFHLRLFAPAHAALADSLGRGTIEDDDTGSGPTGVEPQAPPGQTFLASGFPNPGRREVTLRWGLRRTGPVDLSIYDVQGRLVRTLLRGPESGGWKTAHWDGRDERGRPVPSGVYLVRLEADGRVFRDRLQRVR